jgi:LysM repeat protein
MIEYIVRPGEDLWEIALQHRASVEDLLRANPHVSLPNRLFPGERLVLPFIDVPIQPRRPQKTGLSGQGAPSAGPVSSAPAPRNGGAAKATQLAKPAPSLATRDYIVVPGDTLGAIAARYHTTVAAIVAANPSIQNPNLIYPGQVFHLPAPGETPKPAEQSAPAPAPSTTRKRGINIQALLNLTQELINLRTPYRYGGKARNFSEDPKVVAARGLDCSGFSKYVVGRASNGTIDIGDGTSAQDGWSRKNLTEIPYGDCGKMDGALRIAFENPSASNGANAHVWLVYQGQTLECCGGQGVTRQSYLNYRSMATTSYVLT